MVSIILIPIIGSFILMVSGNLTDSVSLLFVVYSQVGLGTASIQKRKASTSKAKKSNKTVKEAVKEVPVAYPVKTPDIKPSEPSTGLFSRLLSGSTVLANSFRTNLDASQAASSFKSLCKTCTTLKTNLKNFFWSILVFSKLDRFITPKVIFVLSLLGSAVKWLIRGFTVFNLIMIVWIFYFNTPVFTAKLIAGWFMDFFRVLKITYADTVAKFLDYIISIADNGLKSVPKHPENLMDYPEARMYQNYREIFKVLQDLSPKPDYMGDVKNRWYDFLRDRDDFKIYDPINKNPETEIRKSIVSNTFSFLKDNWQYFAVFLGVVTIGSLLIHFWSPISTGIVTIGSAIKTGVVATGSAIKAGFDYICGYLPTFGRSGDPDGVVPMGPTIPNEGGDVPLSEMTPRNTAGPKPLSDGDIRERALSLKFPPSPTHEPVSVGQQSPHTPINLTSPPQTPFRPAFGNDWLRDHWTGWRGERLENEAQTRSGIVEMIRTLREHNLPVPELPRTDVFDPVRDISLSQSSASSSTSSLGLDPFFPPLRQSVIEPATSALGQTDPLNAQALIQGSPVLSRAHVVPGDFAPSPAASVLSHLPLENSPVQGGFKTPSGGSGANG